MHPQVFDMRFRERGRRARTVGLGLLAVATVLWVWCGVLLATSYEVEPEHARRPVECESRLFTDGGTANDGRAEDPCGDERDWPEALAVLGLSVPLSVAGAVLLTYGLLGVRVSEHAAELARLQELAAREKGEADV
ncbi:hypothetical protein [Streptomyces sp. CL12-4]|jgi:ABC-type Na+ efflux pump permease subunit|uniref:hypothetical protein n=1 Tax=Streptomyces sp. CL12-4 TaxID=2810306 RepID=UPI001EFA8496|nr:hypothetical protein [Streptomyces sp. CL12-4]MCG8969303.1 hypothetical protein [Streptomyces sp. CL12-4]